jgi:flavodoxin
MHNTRLSRRDFLKGLVLAAGTSILVSCAPASSSLISTALPLTTSTGRTLKFLIAYDSVYGNTKQLAEAMVEALEDVHETKLLHASETSAADLDGINLILVGSPTHAGTYTDPIKTYLSSLPAGSLGGLKAAAFDTGFERETQKKFLQTVIDVFGYASPKIAKKLEKKGAVVVASETFLVLDTEGPLKEGEIDRAKAWLLDLVKAV